MIRKLINHIVSNMIYYWVILNTLFYSCYYLITSYAISDVVFESDTNNFMNSLQTLQSQYDTVFKFILGSFFITLIILFTSGKRKTKKKS